MNRTIRYLTGRIALTIAVAGAVAGCDPSAKANANDRALFAKDRLSKPYETCARTSDCAEGLRCVQSLCVSPRASVVGDYHAAVGARELAQGNITTAIKSYQAAVERYKSDKISVPTSLYCAQGRALVAAARSPEMAEGAARALDQCLRGAPVGSQLHRQVMADLAVLGSAGLDPKHLASNEPPARYMTKQPSRPATDKLVVKASGDGRKRPRSYSSFLTLIGSPGARTHMIPCWEANFEATKKNALTGAFSFRNRFIEGEYEEDDRYKLSLSSNPPANTAQRCLYDALAKLADEHSKSNRAGPGWNGKITVTISQ
ncbi:MAG: hypothetical protein MJE77_35250 [Proteobacteria bacterium]|nr:hypothetical protein [Pseudomonadota bacterium]